MNAEWLKSVGFEQLTGDSPALGDEEEWGIEGPGVAVTVYPFPGTRGEWYVRQSMDGEGVNVPPPKDEGAALLLLAALGIPFAVTDESVAVLAYGCGRAKANGENALVAAKRTVEVGPYRVLAWDYGHEAEFEPVEAMSAADPEYSWLRRARLCRGSGVRFTGGGMKTPFLERQFPSSDDARLAAARWVVEGKLP